MKYKNHYFNYIKNDNLINIEQHMRHQKKILLVYYTVTAM